MKPIHIDYAPKLLKWKNKTAIIEFANRFYSPSIFIVAFLSAFNLIHHTYAHTFPLLLCIAFVSSIFVAYTSWIRWRKDFIYLAEREVTIPVKSSVLILATECILQFLVSIISFWWISKVPQCVTTWTELNRNTQSYVWGGMLLFTFLFHIYVWKRSSKEMDKCLRDTYDHLDELNV